MLIFNDAVKGGGIYIDNYNKLTNLDMLFMEVFFFKN